MNIKLINLKDVLWSKYAGSYPFPSACTTCGPYYEELIDESEFEALLNEIDSWIKENYESK